MSAANDPLVSVVIPVYNGAAFLAEAVASALNQSYTQLELVIVDNCSDDGTGAIAAEAARRDGRVRVVTNAQHLPMVANWNVAMRQAAPAARYVKVLHCDDLLMPECLARMVAVAEANPSAVIVGAYRLCDGTVDLDGLPYPASLVPGRTVARAALRQEIHVFGSPSSTMLRAEAVRAEPAFYNEANLHADTEACYGLLLRGDWGQVHQVLTYTRRHKAQNSTRTRRIDSHRAARLHGLIHYGAHYFTNDEQQAELERQRDEYYRFLAGARLARDGELLAYHREALAELGVRVSRTRLALATAALVAEKVLDPRRFTQRRRRARKRLAGRPELRGQTP